MVVKRNCEYILPSMIQIRDKEFYTINFKMSLKFIRPFKHNDLLNLSPYSVSKAEQYSLTPYIKMCTTSHKITQA